MDPIPLILAVLGVYLGIGLLFAAGFAVRGVSRVDHAAEGSTWGFRLLVIPGAAAFWPMLLVRWARGARAPVADSPAEGRIERTRRTSGIVWPIAGPMLLLWFVWMILSGGVR